MLTLVKQKRILVVDDDESMRQLVALHLRNAGYRVDTAADAIEAGRHILHEIPDLLVVDVEMPYWNGLDFMATLRADDDVRFVPAIVMTAHENQGLRARRLGLDCLMKPFLKDDLLRLVERGFTPGASAQARLIPAVGRTVLVA
ncbi:MAG: response regulator [Betaproteobacteria bacterium]